MKGSEINITVGNLNVRQVIVSGIKFNEVTRNCGEYVEEVSPMESDYSKAMIALHNYKVENDIWN